ncbi:unnamed protein product [Phytophthora fragariaefolia]|uniref:Unnamed protein product n=1 Tax=Phytophthora fragariaefolia TaxID=1490495 RepID=A0A9W6UD43_9STRA|nr:unnamed protein product [Phytophthora fragariaefolia]
MNTLLVVERVSPLQDEAFIWPSQAEIESKQRRELADRDSSNTLPNCLWNSELSLYITDSERVWIPVSSVDLQQRLGVVRMISRPFGEALHDSAPNEVLHFDFLSLPASTTGAQYVLILKDDMRGFCELIVCPDPTAESACRCLMDRFMRFGPVPQWVSDRGTHFKNKILGLLRKSYGSAHHFTTAYCPWPNGSVEVVNRVLLKCLRAMLSELKLHLSNWPTVLPLVQSALN